MFWKFRARDVARRALGSKRTGNRRMGRNVARRLHIESVETRLLLSGQPLIITGHVEYHDMQGGTGDAAYVRVQAYEKQAIPFTDYLIAEGFTGSTGTFTFTTGTSGNPILNEDSGLLESGTRDIYFKIRAENEACRVSASYLSGVLGMVYWHDSDPEYDVTGGAYRRDFFFSSTGDTPTHASGWGLPAEVKSHRDWLSNSTSPPYAREQVAVLFPDNSWPVFDPGSDWLPWDYDCLRIPESWSTPAETWETSPYTVAHEFGHSVHWAVRGGSWPPGGGPVGEEVGPGGGHLVYSESSPGFAFTEGWAQFFGHARYNSPAVRGLETNDYWMGADGNGSSGPNTDRNVGNFVEGAVASVLWDLWDGVGDDNVSSQWGKIWTVFYNDKPDSLWAESGSGDFYHCWTRRFGASRDVDEIFIDQGIPVRDDQFGGTHAKRDGNHTFENAAYLNDFKKPYQDLILAYHADGWGAEDWYKFQLSGPAPKGSEVRLEYDQRGLLNLELYDKDRKPVGRLYKPDTYSDAYELVNDQGEALPKGLYYINIFSNNNDMSPNYKLTLDIHPGVDVVEVVDRSGSMTGEKLAAAKSAAGLFVGLMNPGDKIGIASYSSSASVNYPLTAIGPGSDVQDAAKAAISQLAANGTTSIGAGVRAADGQLDRFPEDPVRAMIVMTDGLQNTSPEPIGIINSQVDQSIRIFTIGFGSDADETLLTQMATMRNGKYYRATSANLQAIYTELFGAVGGSQQIQNLTGKLLPGEERQQSVSVDPSASLLTIGVSWQGSNLDLQLVAPDGSVITHDTPADNPDVQFVEAPTYEFFKINAPVPGAWVARVIAVDVPQLGEEYNLYAMVDSAVTAELRTDRASYLVGDPVVVQVELDEGTPILGASVTAKVTLPAGAPWESAQVALLDDGQHNDGAANDGLYGNVFSRTCWAGAYRIDVLANGHSAAGFDFLRAPSMSVVLNPAPDSDGDGMPDGWEDREGTDKTVQDATADLDNDELANLDEFFRGTRAAIWDTDADTFSDGLEVNLGSDPLDPASHPHGEIVGNHPQAHVPGWSFRDADQDLVTPYLAGCQGYAELFFDLGNALRRIEIHETTAATSFLVAVKQYEPESGQPGDGKLSVDAITADAGLYTLGVSRLNVVGEGIDVAGPVKYLRLGNVADGAHLRLGGSLADRLIVTAGFVGQNVDFQFGGMLVGLTVIEWAGGSIDVARAGVIHVAHGDFGADLTIDPARNPLGGFAAISVTGDYTGSIDVPGPGGSIAVVRDAQGHGGNVAGTASFHLGGGLASLTTFGGDINLTLVAGGRVGRIEAQADAQGRGGNITGTFNLAEGASAVTARGGDVRFVGLNVGSGGLAVRAWERRVGDRYQGGSVFIDADDASIHGTTWIEARGGDVAITGRLTVYGNVAGIYASKGHNGGGRLVSAADGGQVDLEIRGRLYAIMADWLLMDVDVDSLAWALLRKDSLSSTPRADCHGSLRARDHSSGWIAGVNRILSLRNDDDGLVYTFPH